ncbi:hypothetical protein VaNZ11_005766 [Volvox africanus]|uniref:Protein kinase domain-containing protein n=1 Tax=Volvox africanus TaxID=51714 RepID=A0ABQ5S1B8_9CHLO|nr:hypothetical protein VaNZ11_005766 [Volvox africanus]
MRPLRRPRLAVALALAFFIWLCSGVITITIAAVPATPPPSLPGLCFVDSVQSLLQALSNPQCDLLRIEGPGLTLTQASWAAAVATLSNTSSSMAAATAAAKGGGSSSSASLPPPLPLQITRNVTLEGVGSSNNNSSGSTPSSTPSSSSSSSSNNNVVLNCGYLKSRIAVAAGVTVTIRSLTLLNCRQPSALLVAGVDLLAVNGGSWLVLENVTYKCALCPPLADAVRMAETALRPTAAATGPGQPQQQVVSLVRSNSSSSTCVTPPSTFVAADCVREAILFEDFAQNATEVCPGGVRRPSGGVILYRSVTVQCTRVLNSSCVAVKGLTACAHEAAAVSEEGNGDAVQLALWDTFDMTPLAAAAVTVARTAATGGVLDAPASPLPAAPMVLAAAAAATVVSSTSDSSARRLLAIIVPSAGGGVALIFVFAGLITWTRKRKKFAPCPIGIKEAYEGVVFVGLSQGSETPEQPTDANMDDINLHLRIDGRGEAVPGSGKARMAAKRAELGPEEVVSDGAWSGDGHQHAPSWDGAIDGQPRGSTSITVSNCTSTSGPAIVGIIVASASPATPTAAAATTTATASATAATAGPLKDSATAASPGTPPTPSTPPASGYGYSPGRNVGGATLQPAPPLHPHEYSGNNHHQQQGQYRQYHNHHHHRTNFLNAAAGSGGGGGDDAAATADSDGDGGGGGRSSNTNSSSSSSSSNTLPGASAPVNLILGIDVIVTSQPVLGRSPLGSAMLGQYGQVPVAVKLFHRDCLDGSFEELKALRADMDGLARACCAGRHPNVVEVVGTGETPGGDEVFLLEELMTTHLARVLHEGPGLVLERVLSIALDVALGLSYLHPNIVHQNLKPESVLLDSSLTAKVADYGLGRLLVFGQRPHGLAADTVRARYLAPEGFETYSGGGSAVASRAPAAPSADIYSFGVLLWEMLFREVPWSGLDAAQIAVAVGCQQRRLEIPSNSRCPSDLRKLLLQCWEHDPRKRPSATGLVKRISHLLHQERFPRR